MTLARQWREFFRGPELPADCRDTYRRHFAFAVLDAVSAGILANAPLMALNGLASKDWQVAVQLPISSLGMFAVLYLGSLMANRSPMPFAFLPGIAYAVCSGLMSLTIEPLPFLILGGVGTLFEMMARPAVTAVIRLQYPASSRGAVTGTIRQWHLLTVLVAGAISAWALDQAKAQPLLMIRAQLALAGLVSAISFFIFRTIRLRPQTEAATRVAAPAPAEVFAEDWAALRADGRFRKYLFIGFLFAFGGLVYVAYIPVLFARQLHFGYLASAFFSNTLPSLAAILFTGSLGRWIDRVNSWKAWALIRLGWGLDPLLLAGAPLVAGPAFPVVAAFAGRLSRGSVMGGAWILWWQVGVNHFAQPGGDTTRYMGMIIFMNGLARLTGPAAGAWLLASQGSLTLPLVAGGLLVLLSALLSWRAYAGEKGQGRFATMERFEAAGQAGKTVAPGKELA